MKDLQPIEHSNQRILTTQQLADAYETDAKTISYNFNYNKDRYSPGKHYFALEGNDKAQFLANHREFPDSSKHAPVLYLWTEKGAWLHAKSLNTDRAWEAYEMLVDDYYRLKEQHPQLALASPNFNISFTLTCRDANDLRRVEQAVHHAKRAQALITGVEEKGTNTVGTPADLDEKIMYYVKKLQVEQQAPTARDLSRYINTDTASIQARLDALVEQGVLQEHRSTRATRYTI